MQGLVFKRLTVLSKVEGTGKAKWNCKCRCGNYTVAEEYNIKAGHSKSCGYCKDQAKYPVEYKAWCNMKVRCYDKSYVGYHNYGGRGITVCQEWLDDFFNFLDDMGTRGNYDSLDRKDNDKGYSKENCRWATSIQQGNNIRNSIIKANIP